MNKTVFVSSETSIREVFDQLPVCPTEQQAHSEGHPDPVLRDQSPDLNIMEAHEDAKRLRQSPQDNLMHSKCWKNCEQVLLRLLH